MDNKTIDTLYKELIEEINPDIDDIEYLVRYKLADLPYDEYKTNYDMLIARLTKHYINDIQ